MIKNFLVLGAILILVVVGAIWAFSDKPEDSVPSVATTTPTTPTSPVTATPTPSAFADLIVVASPTKDQKVSSPVTVTGKARGTWYFEASFPVEIHDASGKLIGQGPAQAQGDWMTTEFVPFKATITFTAQPAGSHGTIVFKNDNPSGDPARDQQVSVPVQF